MSAGLPVSQSCRPLPASTAHSSPSSEALPPFMQLISLRTPGPIQEGLKFAEICDNVITVWRFKYATILRHNTAFHFSRVCFTWAESERCPEDAKRNLTVDQRAALRAWTCTPLCYVLTSALREPLYKNPYAAECHSTTAHHGGGTQTNVWYSH